MSTHDDPIDRARQGDDAKHDEQATQGPVPAEPEDVSDTGEGRLGPQPGGDRIDAEDARWRD